MYVESFSSAVVYLSGFTSGILEDLDGRSLDFHRIPSWACAGCFS